MVITLSPDLEAALKEQAQKLGVAPEVLAVNVLRERFLRPTWPDEPRDEWERRLREAASDCGVSLPRSAYSRDDLYE
jgi:hypothetical protein